MGSSWLLRPLNGSWGGEQARWADGQGGMKRPFTALTKAPVSWGARRGPVVRAHAKQTQLRQAGGRRAGQCLQTPPGFQVSDAQTSPDGLPSAPFLFSSLTPFLLPTMLVLSQPY